MLGDEPKIYEKQCQSCPEKVLRARKNDSRPPVCFSCRQKKRREFSKQYSAQKRKDKK